MTKHNDLVQRLLSEAEGCENIVPRASVESRFRQAFAEVALLFREAADRIESLESTPAQPAGAVPDSLRALSEAASALLNACMADMGPLDEGDRDDEPIGMSGFGVGTAVTFGHLRRLEQALASHPAGQSAGSGAEDEALKEALYAAIASKVEITGNNLDGFELGGVDEAVLAVMACLKPAPDGTRTVQGGR